MTVMIIDTLQFSKRMQNAGLGQKIAEELAEAIKDSTSISTENLATKQDLQAVKNDVEITNKDIKVVETSLKQEIKMVEERLTAKIEAVSDKLVIKIGAMITVAVAVIAWLNSAVH